MKNLGTLKVTTPTDREVVLTRVFNAPRHLVFDALTKPELLERWFGPRGWSLASCDVDLRVGGKWRYVLRGPDGRTMGMGGAYLEIARPDRVVHTEAFDDFPGASQVTTILVEQGGKTTLTATVLAPSKEARDAVIQSGMEHGAAETYDRLAELLAANESLEMRHAMKNTGNLKVKLVGDREVVMTRVFDAPRTLVFEAMTKPELLKRWLFGPPGWSMDVCDMDLSPGGKYRWVWRHANGTEMGMGGVHLEVVPPEKIVTSQLFDEDWTGGEVVGTVVLTERDGKTTLTNTLVYSTPAGREAALRTPMEDGMAMGYDRLAEMLATTD